MAVTVLGPAVYGPPERIAAKLLLWVGTAVAFGQKASRSRSRPVGGFSGQQPRWFLQFRQQRPLHIERAVGISEGGKGGLTTVFAGPFYIRITRFSAVASVNVRSKHADLTCFNSPGKP